MSTSESAVNRVDSFPIPTVDVVELRYGLREIVEARLVTVEREAVPVFVHMLGVPGAGKTTVATAVYRALCGLGAPAPLYLDFDRIMSEIPSYAAAADPVQAFATYERPARDAGYALLRAALLKGGSIVFDHGGAVPEHVGIIQFARGLGYTTFMIHPRCSVADAKTRVRERARSEGRHTPLAYVDERAAVIERLLPLYAGATDGFIMIDDTSTHSDGSFAATLESLARRIHTARLTRAEELS